MRAALRRAGYTWRRIRRTLRPKRDQKAFDIAQAELLELHRQAAEGELALFYMDESGFSLQPVVPYGWQAPGTHRGNLSGTHHRRLNVIGMLECNGAFDSFVFEGSVDTDVIIASIDAFLRRQRTQLGDLPIVLVLDNASIHDNDEFRQHAVEWHENGLTLKYLPKYSPELNMIENLWRQMKYHWLPLDATESWEALVAAVDDVLRGVGTEYQITFA